MSSLDNHVTAQRGKKIATVDADAVESNEPLDGPGDGSMDEDWRIGGDLLVSLRAERAGGGAGRVYTTTVTCSDASSNAATGVTTVIAPKRGR